MDSSTAPPERKGLRKLWFKLRASLKSSSTSPTTSQVTSPQMSKPTPAPTTEPTPVQAPEPAPVPAPVQAVPATQESGSNTDKVAMEANSNDTSKKMDTKPRTLSAQDEATKRFERAQAIFKKYNMDLDAADWNIHPKSTIERVHKEPRMRVRWTCHECQDTFGREPICKKCTHERCKKCIRYPPKKTKKTVPVGDATTPAKMPVSGPCHECRTEFTIGATTCSNCHHQICDKCLQETVIASPATAPPASSIPVAAA